MNPFASGKPIAERAWLEEGAHVIGVFSGGVWVEAAPQRECYHCAARGCGRGLLARWRRPAQLRLYTTAVLSIGDRVRVGVPAEGFLHGALVVYGWPLLLAIMAGGLAEQWVPPGHVGVPLAFIAGLALGCFASRWQLRWHSRGYRPVLLAVEP